MELSFDIRGNLKPYKKIELTFEEFKKNFVEPFEIESTRHELLINYEHYLHDFRTEITPNFTQWIDGSFVTNKRNPNDIDIVTIIDFDIANAKKRLLEEKFLNKGAIKMFKIDAYIVRLYPQNHPQYSKSLSDLLYWYHWFSKSRKSRSRKRFPKGFIEISFDGIN